MVLDVMSKMDGTGAPELQARMQICLSEALYNLVLHAEAADKSRPIDVVLTVDNTGDGAVLEIFDPPGATPFDVRTHAPDLSQIDLMAEHGRGLALILECADRVDYGPADGRNRLSLDFVPSDETPDTEEMKKT